ncbi:MULTISPECIES: GntR family transcriptional regulator [Rhodomicrobium]|uniref:GntR family transcriptional regulator n=1 Tax=Rhodomicrobium TaxID=1068 RepID=UPI000B4AE3CB|nr:MULTISPECIES: GntR family transcriptional regulator [Rhodomicrobium]
MNEITAVSRSVPSLHYFAEEEPGSGPISRRHLHDELLVRLRECIIDGELRPGAKIPEKELCERFGVSRTPLREALKVLAFEGLVVLNHNRGSTVSALTLQDLKEAFPIYARLEALAGELACERLTAEEIAEIRDLHEQLLASYEKHDVKGHFAINEQIHKRIEAGSRNRNLVQLIRSVSSRIRRAGVSVDLSGPRWANIIAEHQNIMAAIERRDAPTLSRLLREHIENSFRAIKDTLAPQDKPGMSSRRENRHGEPEAA